MKIRVSKSVRVLIAAFCLLLTGEAHAQDRTESVTLTILSFNDFHGALYELPLRHDPESARGGAVWLAGAIELLRQENPNVVLLDAGDGFQGSWPINATRGQGTVQLYNLLGVDASAVGNHEFDYGPGGAASDPYLGALEEAAMMAEYPILTANVYEADDTGQPVGRWQPPGVLPWTVVERAGIRVGVIGLTTQQTPQTTFTQYVSELVFTDPVEAVRQVLPELAAANVDVVVAVAHLTGVCRGQGFELAAPCVLTEELNRLVTELPPGTIDVIAAGHDHALMAHRIGDTFLISSGAEGSALSRIDLVVEPGGVDADASVLHPPWLLVHEEVDPGCDGGEFPMEPLSVGGRVVQPSPPVLELIHSLEAAAGSLCDPVGCSDRMLARNSDGESEVGNFVADAILHAFPNADLAIQNSGGLRADIPAGPLRREHLQHVMPFDNRLFLVEMSGERLRLLLRLGSAGVHGIFQVSGVAYRVDPERASGDDVNGDGLVENWERDRLCTATIGGEPLDPTRLYKVVVTDFLFNGGDHTAPAFERSTVLEEGPYLRDALYSYAEGLGECLGRSTGTIQPQARRIVLGSCEGGEPSPERPETDAIR